jgi:hypothetical protein
MISVTVDFGVAIAFSPDPMFVLRLIYAQKQLGHFQRAQPRRKIFSRFQAKCEF